MNDDERRQWVDNDEGLYDMWRSSRVSMREFIRHHRKLIDEVAGKVVSGDQRPHYLKYGGR